MKYYWDEFISLFKEQIPLTSLHQILKAFYYFCDNDIDKAKDIMKFKNE